MTWYKRVHTICKQNLEVVMKPASFGCKITKAFQQISFYITDIFPLMVFVAGVVFFKSLYFIYWGIDLMREEFGVSSILMCCSIILAMTGHAGWEQTILMCQKEFSVCYYLLVSLEKSKQFDFSGPYSTRYIGN